MTVRKPKKAESAIKNYTIEKGIPLPPPIRTPGARRPIWFDLAKGDSLFFPNGDVQKLTSASGNWGKRHGGKKFARRIWEQDGIKGVRVWRIK